MPARPGGTIRGMTGTREWATTAIPDTRTATVSEFMAEAQDQAHETDRAGRIRRGPTPAFSRDKIGQGPYNLKYRYLKIFKSDSF